MIQAGIIQEEPASTGPLWSPNSTPPNAVAATAAVSLRREYQPARIVVFGSLVHPEIFGLHSDIDIAVEGIPWPEYLRAWNAVEE